MVSVHWDPFLINHILNNMKKSIILFLFICLLGCKKDKGVKPDGPAEFVTIEYKEKALVVEQENVIVSINEDDQIYTLKKDAFTSQPKAGEVILVPGKMLRKVKSVKTSGNNYVFETEDAAVTDVIENGSFSFETQPNWGDANSITIGGKEILTNGKTMSSLKNGMGAIDPIQTTISHGGIDHTIIITPTMKNGSINSCSFQFLMKKQGENTSFLAEGTATLPSQKTEIVIKNGQLTKFNSDNNGLKGNFSITMATAGGFSSSHSLPLPEIGFSFPIRVLPTPMGPIPNPIPMSINVGVNFVSQMTISGGMSSATAKSKVTYDGSAGFSYKGTEVSTTGLMNSGDIKEGIFDSGGFGTTVDLQFGFAFPRIALNIAGQEAAFIRLGYTTGSSLYFGPICKQGYAKLIMEGGYSFKVLGKTLLSGEKKFYEKEERAGEDCSKRGT